MPMVAICCAANVVPVRLSFKSQLGFAGRRIPIPGEIEFEGKDVVDERDRRPAGPDSSEILERVSSEPSRDGSTLASPCP